MNKSSMVAAVGTIAGLVLLLSAQAANARDQVSWSVNIGVPAVSYPGYAPVYAPPVVYARPAPIYVQPAPVYYAPPAVVYAPQPYYERVYYNSYAPRYYWDHGQPVYYGHGYGAHYRHGR